jgi:hypothetical protein
LSPVFSWRDAVFVFGRGKIPYLAEEGEGMAEEAEFDVVRFLLF